MEEKDVIIHSLLNKYLVSVYYRKRKRAWNSCLVGNYLQSITSKQVFHYHSQRNLSIKYKGECLRLESQSV